MKDRFETMDQHGGSRVLVAALERVASGARTCARRSILLVCVVRQEPQTKSTMSVNE